MSSTAKSLVIVESPAKAKTIVHYLGAGYEVKASMGHIIDLPEKTLGVDIEHDFKPTYEVLESRKKVVKELERAAGEAKEVFLASDPDREGEAIAWHIYEKIKKKNKNIYRIQFNEITKSGIQQGISRPGKLNMQRVEAQQSRRILDRLVGFQVSRLLWKPLRYGLSAGRVQSVALRIICEREGEIERFISEEWWSIAARLQVFDKGKKLKGEIEAALDKINGKKVEMTLKTAEDAEKIVKGTADKEFKITGIEKKKVQKTAPPPYITARLQQDAINRLGFNAKTVMSTAQQLYEGLDLGKAGQVGLITYMRTDSTRIAPEAEAEAKGYINKEYGAEYVGTGAKAQKKPKAGVQDAHEAIRPTSVLRTPDSIKANLTPQQYKLYKLIWERFVASLMANAVYEQTTLNLKADIYDFKASGRVPVFAGYTAIYEEQSEEEEEKKALLNVAEEDKLKLQECKKEQHFTQAPPRFTEASLVQALEKQGIGRPSTYASIISTIVEREYVEQREKRMFPTELGRLVNRLLIANFPKIFELKFTATMEEGLDKVEEGGIAWLTLMKDFYKSFSKELAKAVESFESELSLPDKCPKCGKALTIKCGKTGVFVACTGYPECKFSSDFKRGEQGKIVLAEKEKVSTGLFCEKCGAEMVIKNSRYGELLGCSAYPECKNIKNFLRLKDGGLVVLETGEKLGDCPRCKGGELVLKSGKTGVFAGCSRYPECKYTSPVSLDESGKVILEAPKDYGVCEKCGKPMVLRKSFRGPFIACSGYPECKNAKSMKSLGLAAGGSSVNSAEASSKPSVRKSAAKKPSPKGVKNIVKKGKAK